MIIDLVSAWLAASETPDLTARTRFRSRHAPLLELLRRSRAPLSDTFPLAAQLDRLRGLARRAADPARHQLIRDILARAADFGADGCHSVVLLAGEDSGDSAEPIPWPDPCAVLFLDRIDDDDQLVTALARAAASATRWAAADSRTRMHRDRGHGWDRWRAGVDVPLREWIYSEGVGLRLAHALQPGLAPHTLLGVTRAVFSRLQQREKVLRAWLEADLDHSGVALLMRWLTPGVARESRGTGGTVLPPMAGRYLAWRMLADRVSRIELREAIRMES